MSRIFSTLNLATVASFLEQEQEQEQEQGRNSKSKSNNKSKSKTENKNETYKFLYLLSTCILTLGRTAWPILWMRSRQVRTATRMNQNQRKT